MTTQFDLANRALAMAGTRSQITDFVSTPEGLYCGLLYNEFRDYLLRTTDPDFALAIEPPVVNAPVVDWIFSYQYPTGCVRIRQLVPVNLTEFDPQPVQWFVGGGTSIFATVAIQSIFMTSNLGHEDVWDASFTDAFVRLLASGLFFALENRIEAHNVAIKEALEFAAQSMVINP